MTPGRAVPAAAAVASLLAATGLHGLFRGLGWYPPVAVAALVATAIVAAALALGWLARLLLPVVLLAGLAEFSLVYLARRRATFGVLPGRGAIRLLRAQADSARHLISVLVVPVPDHPQLVMVAAAGVFVAAAAATYLALTGRAGLAGVPLMALLVVSASVHGTHVGALSFGLAAAGWLLLLAAEVRTRRAAEAPAGTEPVAGLAHAPTGAWRIASVALATAVVIPVLAPSLTRNLIDHGAGGGGGSITVVPPLVTLENELHSRHPIPLLRVTASQPTYLQLTALEAFTGSTFTLHSLTSAERVGTTALPAPAITGPTTTVSVSVDASASYAQHYLALPYAVDLVNVPGSWLLDRSTRTVFSVADTTRDLDYTAVSAVPDPTPAQLAATGSPDPGPGAAPRGELGYDTQVPISLLAQLRPLALAHSGGAHNAFQAAEDLQSWLRGPQFTYTLAPQDYSGPFALVDFLETGRGDCEQFSSAMVALLRSLGIPARVAVGFTPGTLVGPHSYLVTTADAHAWPQVWLRGIGWLRFEPTPGGQPGSSVPSYENQGQLPGGAHHNHPTTKPSPSTGPATGGHQKPQLGHKRVPTASPGAAGLAPPVRHRHAGTSGLLVGLVVVAAVVLLALSPAVLRQTRRRGRWRAAGREPSAGSLAAWAELLESARDLGWPLTAAATPRSVTARLALVLDPADPAAATLRALARRVEQERYAAAGTATGELPSREQLRRLHRAMRAARTPGERLRATLAPPSLLDATARGLSTAVADLLDRLDRAMQIAAALPLRLLGRHSGADRLA